MIYTREIKILITKKFITKDGKKFVIANRVYSNGINTEKPLYLCLDDREYNEFKIGTLYIYTTNIEERS